VAALERRSEGELGRGGATAARPCRQRGGEGAAGEGAAPAEGRRGSGGVARAVRR
jgi:hypothetical protein